MEPFIIFRFFRNKHANHVFLISAVLIAILYLVFSVVLALVTTRPFPKGPVLDVIAFGWIKANSFLLPFDWIIFILIVLSGAMLFANYSYWRCGQKAAGKVGITAGVIAATCPACILPVLGISALGTAVAVASNIIKVAIVLVLVGATYFIVNKQKKCGITP